MSKGTHSATPDDDELITFEDFLSTVFDEISDKFIADIAWKIFLAKEARSATEEGSEYCRILVSYIGMMESAKIAATAHRDSTVRDR
jgi:hypothetical protein